MHAPIVITTRPHHATWPFPSHYSRRTTPVALLPLRTTRLSLFILTDALTASALAFQELAQAVESHDDAAECVVLLRTGDAYGAVLAMPLVPEIGVCRALAAEYADKEALQLSIDDL